MPHNRFGLSTTTPPAALPVTTEEVRRQLRVKTTAEDDLVRTYVEAAVQSAEHFLNLQLIQATQTLSLPRFPSGSRPLRLRRGPLVSVTSITYIDPDGASTPFTQSGNWQAITDVQPPEVRLEHDIVWPAFRVQEINPITIVYISGYGLKKADVPADIRLGVCALAAYYFENRMLEGDIPEAIQLTLLPQAIIDPSEG